MTGLTTEDCQSIRAALMKHIEIVSSRHRACSHHTYLTTFTFALVLPYVQRLIACIIPATYNIINNIITRQIHIRYYARYENY
jgi:hypothetical protein